MKTIATVLMAAIAVIFTSFWVIVSIVSSIGLWVLSLFVGLWAIRLVLHWLF